MDKYSGDESPYAPPVSVDTPQAITKKAGDQAVITLRLLDNVIQAACIAVCTLLGGIIGASNAPAFGFQAVSLGLVAGLFFGRLTGLLGSGIFLMLYRSGRRSQRSVQQITSSESHQP